MLTPVSVWPATTILPSGCRITAEAWSIPPKLVTTLPPAPKPGVEAAVGVVAREGEVRVGVPDHHELAVRLQRHGERPVDASSEVRRHQSVECRR